MVTVRNWIFILEPSIRLKSTLYLTGLHWEKNAPLPNGCKWLQSGKRQKFWPDSSEVKQLSTSLLPAHSDWLCHQVTGCGLLTLNAIKPWQRRTSMWLKRSLETVTDFKPSVRSRMSWWHCDCSIQCKQTLWGAYFLLYILSSSDTTVLDEDLKCTKIPSRSSIQEDLRAILWRLDNTRGWPLFYKIIDTLIYGMDARWKCIAAEVMYFSLPISVAIEAMRIRSEDMDWK